jgi:hypothetical protein
MNYLEIKQTAENRIIRLRETEVMIDKDVAELYDIKETAELNRKVKNNPEKFTGDLYYFDLTKEEKSEVIEAYPRLESLKHSPNIKAYTEYGILMLATTFQASNKTAIDICHILVQTFIEYRKKAKSLIASDSIISEIKRDIELLKKFALMQHHKNEEVDEHFEAVLSELHHIKSPVNQTDKNKIGFQMGTNGKI